MKQVVSTFLLSALCTSVQATNTPIIGVQPFEAPMTTLTHEQKISKILNEDPYAWIEDVSYFNRNHPQGPHKEKINTLVQAEREKFNVFRDLAAEERIYNRLVSMEEPNEDSYPCLKKGYRYFIRYYEGKDYVAHMRVKVGSDIEECILDENQLKESGTYDYFDIGAVKISKNDLLAYSLDSDGTELYDITVKDLQSNEIIDSAITKVAASIIWHNTLPGFFYKEKINSVSKKVYFHMLGQSRNDDILIYQENNPLCGVGISTPGDGQFLFISSGHSSLDTLHLVDMKQENFALKTIISEAFNSKEVGYSAVNNYLYVSVNPDPHHNFQLFKINFDTAEDQSTWRLLIDSEPNRLLRDFKVYSNHLAVVFMENATSHLYLYDLNDITNRREIKISDEPCDISIVFEETTTPYLRFNYQTMTQPLCKYEVDFATFNVSKVYEKKVPNYDASAYESQLLMLPSHDDTFVPVSILKRKDTPSKGVPLFVYAYGSYGIEMTPSFSKRATAIANEGFVYAIVHARGGSECGYEWYLNGKMNNKLNTFKDVIHSTHHLCQIYEVNTPSQVAVMGGSAGGLVVGYCANTAPDLFGVAIGVVPFVDVLKDMLTPALPLTQGEFYEWGNPSNEDAFNYIAQYDPIYNVSAHNYPDTLLTAGLADHRVPYWEPFKLALSVREARTDKEGLTFVHTYETGGHFAGSGRYSFHKEVAIHIAFTLKAMQTWHDRRK